MARTMDEKIQAMEKDLQRAYNIKRIYNEVKRSMEAVTGRSFKNPDTNDWDFHEYTDNELEAHECIDPFTGEVFTIWDSKREVEEMKDIYQELLEFLVKMA